LANSITVTGIACCLSVVALKPAVVAGVGAGQFTSGVNLVEVYASVTDGQGTPVTGLKQADFELRENGELQAIANFTAGDFPLSWRFAIDRSFSVAGAKLTTAKAAAETFLAELRPKDEAMIIAVGSQVEVVAPLSIDRSSQRDAIAATRRVRNDGIARRNHRGDRRGAGVQRTTRADRVVRWRRSL
jgi:VWFA-related protein